MVFLEGKTDAKMKSRVEGRDRQKRKIMAVRRQTKKNLGILHRIFSKCGGGALCALIA